MCECVDHATCISSTSQMYRHKSMVCSAGIPPQLSACSNSGDQALSPPSISGLETSFTQHLDITQNSFWLAILPAGCARSTRPAGLKNTLRLLPLFISMYESLCVHTYHMCNNHVTYLLPCDLTLVNFALCSYYEYSSTVTRWRWILRSRGNIDATTWGWPRAETPEASSYSWCLRSH